MVTHIVLTRLAGWSDWACWMAQWAGSSHRSCVGSDPLGVAHLGLYYQCWSYLLERFFKFEVFLHSFDPLVKGVELFLW